MHLNKRNFKYYVKALFWHSKYLFLKLVYKSRAFLKPIHSINKIILPVNWHWSVFLLKNIYENDLETGELNILGKTLSETDRVLELGTGLGLTSTFCSKIVGSENVFTFEANPTLAPHLKNMYQLNNVHPNLEFKILSGNKTGSMSFYVDKKNALASSVHRINKKQVEIKVPYSNFNETLNTIKPSYLIIDIEGAEHELLMHASLEHIQKIQIELHPIIIGDEKVNEVIKFIESKGFKRNTNITKDQYQAYFYI